MAQTNGVALPADELRVVLDQVRILQTQAVQREAVIRALQDSLAAARAENEVLRRQWDEARLRAQTLGANPGDREVVVLARQLGVAVQEQVELIRQVAGLISAVESGQDVAGELRRAKELFFPAAMTNQVPVDTRTSAKVVDVNLELRMAVLDMGVRQNVRIGMPVQAWRGDRLVAELRIVDVRTRISGALIERVERGVNLQIGDQVRVTGSQMELKK